MSREAVLRIGVQDAAARLPREDVGNDASPSLSFLAHRVAGPKNPLPHLRRTLTVRVEP